MNRGMIRITLFLVSALMAVHAGAQDLGKRDFSELFDEEPEFLPVDEAFVLNAEVADDGSVRAHWVMPDGYYLYRHRFGFETNPDSGYTLGAAEIAPGKKKMDEWFGEVEVYYHDARARVPVTSKGSGVLEVGISYQGCADRGLCYPPETKWLVLAGGGGSGSGGVDQGDSRSETAPTETAPAETAATEELRLAGLLGESFWVALGLFFLGGIGLAFTPCVLPMVPILSSIIVGESTEITRRRALSLSLAYVLGMAVTYAALGVLVGLFGASMNLQAALQSPPVLVGFAAVFVLLSFSMFGFYELQLPQGLQNRLNVMSQNTQGGKHLGVVAMGSLSSLVVSPCVSAPLAGALIYISSTGDAVLGGGALLALGLGMGVPLVLIGASGGHLLPRAGVWMEKVKAAFGVGLLAVAIWLLERVVPGPVSLLLWAALAIGAGVYLGAMDFAPRQGWGQLWKASGAFSFIYGILLLIGASSGAVDPLRPLSAVAFLGGSGAPGGVRAHAELDWRPVKGRRGLEAELALARDAGQPAMLDFYADWCISCKVMERNVFPVDGVSNRLEKFRLLRADVTDNDALDQALLESLGLFGPPSMLFFAEDGVEIARYRVQGELDADAMETHLGLVLAGLDEGSSAKMLASSPN